jgi:hypothetical protein
MCRRGFDVSNRVVGLCGEGLVGVCTICALRVMLYLYKCFINVMYCDVFSPVYQLYLYKCFINVMYCDVFSPVYQLYLYKCFINVMYCDVSPLLM